MCYYLPLAFINPRGRAYTPLSYLNAVLVSKKFTLKLLVACSIRDAVFTISPNAVYVHISSDPNIPNKHVPQCKPAQIVLIYYESGEHETSCYISSTAIAAAVTFCERVS